MRLSGFRELACTSCATVIARQTGDPSFLWDLEDRTSEPTLPDDRGESPDSELGVVGDGNRRRQLAVAKRAYRSGRPLLIDEWFLSWANARRS